ncbi:MAG: killer suppression protein [Deltaproteobacteria bacterium RIFOXYA12_FULL_58_15]|nr:MAG: killer suppression protein [Deltaproteobacteria bacterium RIFOXYA12_FULL_58_15]OGR09142.1 MAG: killer suppression protein [Deltaproteobacteria bacterium RIFOXYB12_FULL_58_9]
MDIEYKTEQIKRDCNEDKRAKKRWGTKMAKWLRKRLDDLAAASDLNVMRTLPGRCHELKGDRTGQLGVDLVHPQRLVFEPSDNPPPVKPDGGLDWSGVRAIRILEVEDYHG